MEIAVGEGESRCAVCLKEGTSCPRCKEAPALEVSHTKDGKFYCLICTGTVLALEEGDDPVTLTTGASTILQGMGELRGAIAKRKQITEWLRELGGDHPYENKDVELWLDSLTEPHSPLPLLRRFLFHLADRIDAKDFALRVAEPPGGWATPEESKS
jgi:hypothetical protein